GDKITEISSFIETLYIYQNIAQLEIAIDDTRPAMIVRHLEPFTIEDLEKLRSFAQEINYWIYLQSKGPDTIFRLYPQGD
ncbi:23S rRNA (uracil(1939)-C(5))-methyltransferase, partial [Francisella tularensis subsp. holarctica]|nr:23S rRNA (uracil(1939)-C(5))-methyltransferase [Francisella tularensis subsp. holarctica]